MPRIPTGHWDLGLLKFLENYTCSLKCCYLWPPLGSYIEHVSGCDPTFAAGRPGCWGESFACEGTRVADDRHHREKYLAAFRPKKGPPRWLSGPLKIDDPAKDYRWFTLAGQSGTIINWSFFIDHTSNAKAWVSGPLFQIRRWTPTPRFATPAEAPRRFCSGAADHNGGHQDYSLW